MSKSTTEKNKARSTVLIIAGMHRSGTSMIAHMLGQIGMYLGPEKKLIPAASDNPDGFWENRDFVDINKELLQRFGGSWDVPPPLPANWVRSRSIQDLREKAKELIAFFKDYSFWGWKDPRNSITLPFWKQFVPDARVLLCVRNPQEVALSLQKRNQLSLPSGWQLWFDYNRAALNNIRKMPHLVTYYDAYFHDAAGEILRIAEWLGIPVDPQHLQKVREIVKNRMRHARLGLDDLRDTGIPAEILKLYLQLLEKSGPIYEASVKANQQSVYVVANIPSAGEEEEQSPTSTGDSPQMLLEAEGLIEQGNYPEAERILTTLLEQNPDNLDDLNNLAVLKALTGELTEAVAHLQKVLTVDPHNENARENLQQLQAMMPELQAGSEGDKEVNQANIHPGPGIYSTGKNGSDGKGFSIIIPTHNGKQMLLQCLRSLQRMKTPVSFEVIVVDNASTDGTIETVEDLRSRVSYPIKLLTLDQNAPFARANNLAVEVTEYEYLLFLNNDTEAVDDFLSLPLNYLQRPEVGAVGIKLLFPDGLIQHAGVAFDERKTPHHVFRFYPGDFSLANEIREVQAVTGACLFMRKSVFRELEGFDESYINGYQDIDLCFQLWEKGLKVIYTPEVYLYHLESQTTGRLKKVDDNRQLFLSRWNYKIVVDLPEIYHRTIVSRLKSLSGQQMESAESLAFAIKIGVPDRSHQNWGDILYARSLAKSLKQLGHRCAIHYLNEWDQRDEQIDVVIHIKGLSQYRPKPYNFNILWIINHPELHTPEEINRYDLVFVASEEYLRHILPKVKVPVYYLPQATDAKLFHADEPAPEKDIDVLFIGNNYEAKRGGRRKIIDDLLKGEKQYNLWVYGQNWEGFIDPQYIKGAFVDYEELPRLYQRAKIVLNDHQETMQKWGFINNRTFDLARVKAFQISNAVPGLEALGVVNYSSPKELQEKIDYYLAHPEEREKNVQEVSENCQEFTFEHRAEQIQSYLNKQRGLLNQKRRGYRERRIIRAPEPKVSVLMTTYNREATLADAIQSVVSQTYPYWELIVVNDGGREVQDIIDTFQDPRIRYFSQPHRGKPAALNFAIQQARGEYIAYLDDDDRYLPNHLQVHLSYLECHPQAGFTYSFSEEVNYVPEGHGWREHNRGAKYNLQIQPHWMRLRNYIPNLCAVHRKVLFEQAGVYDESLRVLIDWDMYRRLAVVSPPVFLNQLTAEYRRQTTASNFAEGQITGVFKTDPVAYYCDRLRILRKPFPLKPSEIGPETAVLFYLNNANRHEITYALYKIAYLLKQVPFVPVLLIDTDIDQGIVCEVQQIEVMVEVPDGLAYWNHDKLPLNHFLEAFLQDGWWSKYIFIDDPAEFTEQNLKQVQVGSEGFYDFSKQRRRLNLSRTNLPLLGRGSPNTPRVSIVIPTFNNWHYTERCLKALLQRNENETPFEVIIVDNGSTDGTPGKVEALSKQFPNLRLIANRQNEGFARACNQGAAAARGEFILLLNNDTEPEGRWLDRMVDAAEMFPTVGAVGAKLLYPNNRTIQHAGVGITDHPHPIYAYHLHHNQPEDFPAANQICEYQAVTAACMLVPGDVWKQVGGLDEGYLNGYEDVDFCFTLRERGYRIVYQPRAVVLHYESRTAGRFKHVEHNVRRLHQKWLGRIRKDEPDQKVAPLVSIIVLAGEEAKRLPTCLEQIEKNSSIHHELIVVANGDLPASLFEKQTASFRWIRNQQPLSRVRRMNQGLAVARGEYLVLIDDDVLVPEGWLEKLVRAFRQDESVAMVCPVSNFDFGLQLDPKAAITSVTELERYQQQIALQRRNAWQEVARHAFYCVAVHRKLVKAIGGLDERLNELDFYEDDYCLRTRLAGYKSLVAHDVVVLRQLPRQSLKPMFSEYQALRQKMGASFVRKWGNRPETVLYNKVQISNPSLLQVPLQPEEILRQATIKDSITPPQPARESTPVTVQQVADPKVKLPPISPMIDVSIIILTYNQLKFTQECLASIEKFTGDVRYELILVDNGSRGGTVPFLVKWKNTHCNVKLILNRENRGFAAGNNQGIRHARGRYILLLNNDVVVTPGWLKTMVQVLQSENSLGLVGPMTNYIRGPQRVTEVPYKTDVELLEYSRSLQRKFGSTYVLTPLLVGFCLLIKREVVEQVGLLDERFGRGNYEDDDFCLRVTLAGYKMAIARGVFVHHYGNRSFKGNNIDYIESLKQNQTIFIEKWKDLKEPLPLWIMHLLERANYAERDDNITEQQWALQRAFQIAPDNKEVVQHYFNFLIHRGEEATALQVLTSYLQRRPDDAEALNQMGVLLWQKGELQRAIQFFEKAVQLWRFPRVSEKSWRCLPRSGRI